MNHIVHLQFAVTDLHLAKKFYSTIFDWDIEFSKDIPDYLFFKTKGNQNLEGGIGLVENKASTGDMRIYINVEDINGTLHNIVSNGGKMILEKTKLPGDNGWISRFEDPSGNIMGLWSETE